MKSVLDIGCRTMWMYLILNYTLKNVCYGKFCHVHFTTIKKSLKEWFSSFLDNFLFLKYQGYIQKNQKSVIKFPVFIKCFINTVSTYFSIFLIYDKGNKNSNFLFLHFKTLTSGLQLWQLEILYNLFSGLVLRCVWLVSLKRKEVTSNFFKIHGSRQKSFKTWNERTQDRHEKGGLGSKITTNYCFKHKYRFLLGGKNLLKLLLKSNIKISRKNSILQ